MDKHKHIDESILLSYFSGNLSISQLQEVEDWISRSEENRKIARDIQYLYQAADTLTYIKQINPYTALKNVRKESILDRKFLYSHGYNVLRLFSSYRFSFPLHILH